MEEHNDKFVLNIGKLIIHWANTESLFQAIFYILSQAPMETVQVLWFTRKSTRDRIDFTLRLAQTRIKDEGLLGKVQDLAAKFITHSSLRNHYSHALYELDKNNRLLRAITVDTPYGDGAKPMIPIVKEFEHIRLNELKEERKHLLNLSDDLWDLVDELQEYLKVQLVERPEWLAAK